MTYGKNNDKVNTGSVLYVGSGSVAPQPETLQLFAEEFGSNNNQQHSSTYSSDTYDEEYCKRLTNDTVNKSAQWTGKVKTTKGTKISCGNVDKRVCLTVAPKTASRDETLFINKVKYVLGPKFYDKNQVSWLTTSKFYGLLRNALGSTSGLIFPYTPTVQFSHQVNYDTTDIMHSNLSFNSYKNSPPPTIGLTAKFTADNRDNALHMLSAIWFLVACSKCEFGENSEYPGLPPPILYLSGYDHLIDNIPVVISSLSYSYPSDLHYVNLILDMSKDYNKGEEFCRIYDSTRIDEGTVMGKPAVYTSKTGINMSYWLPTELEIQLQLKIQPNLLKTKKQWTLDGYKTSLLMTNNSKNPPVEINILENTTVTSEISGTDIAKALYNYSPLGAGDRYLINYLNNNYNYKNVDETKVDTSLTNESILLSGIKEISSKVAPTPSNKPKACPVPAKKDNKKYIEFIPSGWTW